MRVRYTSSDERFHYFEVRVPKRQLATQEVVKLTDTAGRLLYYPLAKIKDKGLSPRS